MTYASLIPPIRTLMGPGPSDVHPRVLQALAKPTVGHLDPAYMSIMNSLQVMLRQLFQTTNPMTFAISGTGSAGMEATLVNLLEPGDSILVCVNGVFGGRMVDVATRAGAVVHRIDRPWGEVFSPDEIRDAMSRTNPRFVAIVMAETSTGAWQPIREVSDVVHQGGAMLIVDAVTSLGGVPVEVDLWKIDAIYSGTQKCLSCPPGLSPVSFSPRAVGKIMKRKTKVQSWYLDVSMLSAYWGQERAYHHTAPINMTYGLYEALLLILEEGLATCFARHLLNHRALKAGLEAIGIHFSAAKDHRLPMLNAVQVPNGIEDTIVRAELLARFGIEIGGGLGDFKGRVWRIGLMGYGSRASNVLLFLSALEQVLGAQGHRFAPGASVAAANSVYREG
jgi:alanine-glyoxylate transaminase/serine-glyoxylate transaminase/serine-pyruvate transaminase